MSSSTTSTFSSTSSSPTASGSEGIGLPGISRSGSLLFGFLIAFLVLFVAFMSCGLGSRRLMDQIRGGSGTLDAANENGPSRLKQERPLMWHAFVSGSPWSQFSWLDIKPLSASYVRSRTENSAKPSTSVRPSPLTHPERYAQFIGGFGGHHAGGHLAVILPPPLPPTRMRPSPLAPSTRTPFVAPTSWVRRFVSSSSATTPRGDSANGSEQKSTKKETPEELQVTMLIAMPHRNWSSSQEDGDCRNKSIEVRDEDGLRPYVLGTTRVAYHMMDVMTQDEG